MVDINIKDEYDRTFLYKATLDDNKELAQVLLENKANPNLPCRSGLTALHVAAENGNIDILKLLIKYDGNIKVVNENNSSLIHSAAIGIKDGRDNWGVIKWLLEQKEQQISPFGENDRNQTPRDILEHYDYSYAEKYDDILEALGCYSDNSN
jgi:ankyrin repeat protein